MATLHTKEKCGVCGLYKDKLRDCFYCERQPAAPASAVSASKRRAQELEAALDAALEQSDDLLASTGSGTRPSRSSRALTSFVASGSRALGGTLHPHDDELRIGRTMLAMTSGHDSNLSNSVAMTLRQSFEDPYRLPRGVMGPAKVGPFATERSSEMLLRGGRPHTKQRCPSCGLWITKDRPCAFCAMRPNRAQVCVAPPWTPLP